MVDEDENVVVSSVDFEVALQSQFGRTVKHSRDSETPLLLLLL